MGGVDSIFNMILLCYSCHTKVHKDESLAACSGWISWADPEVTPYLHAQVGWVLPDPDGRFERLDEDEAHRLLDWVNGCDTQAS